MEHESESGVNSWGFPERSWQNSWVLQLKFIGDIEYGEKGVSMKNLYRLKQILGVGADFLLEGAEDGISEEKEIKILQENIMGLLERVFCKAAWRHGTDRTTVCGRYRPG